MIILVPFVVLLAVIVGFTAFDLVFRRNLRRIALRNMARRPVEALLVVGGAALGTAIITSAFVVGDTFDASVRDFARTDLGPVDEVVTVSDVGQLDEIAAAIENEPPPETDGVMSEIEANAAVRAGDKAEPSAYVGEIDFDAARQFGGSVAITGMAEAGATPAPGEAVIHADFADDLAVTEGDTIELFAYGQRLELTVRTVLDRVGLAGLAQVYVAPGTLGGLAAEGTIAGAEPPWGRVLVSNTGGVFDSVDHSVAVTDVLEERFADIDGVEVTPTKEDLLDDAAASGAEVRDMFSMMGTFSAVVGVLLLVNLFVMLAEERKQELGMLRAVGMKRNQLVRMFGLEGGLYSIAAALVGVVAGVAIGQVVVIATQSIFAADEDDFRLVLSLDPASLIAGGLIGLTVALFTVWGTSARIARLNVMSAIRDLPDPGHRRTSWLRLVVGAVGVLLGAWIFSTGSSSESAIPVLVGPAIAAASAVPLFSRILPRRLVVGVAGGLAAFWAVAAFEVSPEAFEDAGIEMFVVQGLVLVGAAVAVVAQGDRVWAWLSDRFNDRFASRGGVVSRLAVAYPLARRGRTAILLAMFSLVIFTMTFMSAITRANLAQAPRLAEEAAAGWDLWVDSSPSNPLRTDQVAADPDAEAATSLLRGWADVSTESVSDAESWPVSGIDASLVEYGTPELSDRLDRYDDDKSAFQAVADDPTLTIVSDELLSGGGPPGAPTVELGEEVTAASPVTGDKVRYTVVGLVDEDWNGHGLMISRDAVETLVGDRAVENRHYVRVAEGADPDVVADRLSAEWVTNGADAESFTHMIESEMKEMQGFIRLLQGYLLLGLIIGIAGLGVVMVRAVRERRRQIGMLRAMGFSARVVRRAFMAEAGFVAIQGIVLGIGLGLVTSYQLLTSDVFGDPLPFTVPWLAVGVLFVVPAAAAFAAAVAPAAQAAKIQPAAALRIAE